MFYFFIKCLQSNFITSCSKIKLCSNPIFYNKWCKPRKIDQKTICHRAQINKDLNKSSEAHLYFHPTCSDHSKCEAKATFIVVEEFISEEEENNLIKELDPYFERSKYEFDHFDDAIHGFKETERSNWSNKCNPIIRRLKEASFKEDNEVIPQVHILDLSPEGVIKPHIDSVRFCGNTISGLCLLSDAVMRLIREDDKNQIIDAFLPRRGLYIMKNALRYKYTHEILSKESSYFGGKYVKRDRRVSVICRNPPD